MHSPPYFELHRHHYLTCVFFPHNDGALDIFKKMSEGQERLWAQNHAGCITLQAQGAQLLMVSGGQQGRSEVDVRVNRQGDQRRDRAIYVFSTVDGRCGCIGWGRWRASSRTGCCYRRHRRPFAGWKADRSPLFCSSSGFDFLDKLASKGIASRPQFRLSARWRRRLAFYLQCTIFRKPQSSICTPRYVQNSSVLKWEARLVLEHVQRAGDDEALPAGRSSLNTNHNRSKITILVHSASHLLELCKRWNLLSRSLWWPLCSVCIHLYSSNW